MASIALAKTKRKDMEDVYDDFSDFSLSSPARKIRRLDAELPPITEEDDQALPLVSEQMSYIMPMTNAEQGTSHEERALVLYNPADSAQVPSPSTWFTVSSHILSGLKNKAFWPRNPDLATVNGGPMEDNQVSADNCLALVPWQAPVAAHMTGEAEWRGGLEEDAMDDDAAGVASMEVEDDQGGEATVGVGSGDSLHQWPQHYILNAYSRSWRDQLDGDEQLGDELFVGMTFNLNVDHKPSLSTAPFYAEMQMECPLSLERLQCFLAEENPGNYQKKQDTL